MAIKHIKADLVIDGKLRFTDPALVNYTQFVPAAMTSMAAVTVRNTTGTMALLSDFAPYQTLEEAKLKQYLATGFVSGLDLTINTNPTKFDIAAGKYVVTDYNTDPNYLQLLENKFGKSARLNMEETLKIKLKRKLLGD